MAAVKTSSSNEKCLGMKEDYPMKGSRICGMADRDVVMIFGIINSGFAVGIFIHSLLLLMNPQGFDRHDLLIFIPGAEDLRSLMIGVLLISLVIFFLSILLAVGAILGNLNLIMPWMSAIPMVVFTYITGTLLSIAVYSEEDSVTFIAAQAASVLAICIILFIELSVITGHASGIE